MIRPRDNKSPGGNRTIRGAGGRYYQPPEEPSKIRALKARTDSEYGVVECPVCGETVGLRKNGSICSHRVGSSMRTSYPCAGSGPITRS